MEPENPFPAAAYKQKKLAGVESRYANLPVNVPAEYNAVRDAILRGVESRK